MADIDLADHPTQLGSALPGVFDPEARLCRVAVELADRYAGVFSPETVERYVLECHEDLGLTARIHTHLVTLTQRFATERLTALAQAEGRLPKELVESLFVCVHNAGRSQMAATLMHHRADGRVHVRSAGSAPAGGIEPAVAYVMGELGLDLSAEFPKPLTDEVVQAADVVITMGCGDACPVYLGRRYLDWQIEDPVGQPVERVRAIRDDIDARVQALLADLIPRKPSLYD